MPNKANRWIVKKFEELRKEFGNKCAYCGAKNVPLEFAHIEPTELNGESRGRKERYYDIVRNKQSYTLLGEECHKKYDRGELTTEEVSVWE